MANTFKSSTTDGSALNADTWATLYTCPSSTTSLILQLGISNIGAVAISIDIEVVKNADDDVYIVKEMIIPPGTSFEFGQGQKYVLQVSDLIRVRCDTANSMDAMISYLEMT